MIFRAWARKCQFVPNIGVNIPSCNGESVDFKFVSYNDNGHKSSSSLGALECSQFQLALLVRLGHAIVLHSGVRLR